jgi:hypothetical protein
MGYYGPFAIFQFRNCMFVLYLYVTNVIYLVPNKAVKKQKKKKKQTSKRSLMNLILREIKFISSKQRSKGKYILLKFLPDFQACLQHQTQYCHQRSLYLS